jgi:Glycosyl hydrolases family 28
MVRDYRFADPVPRAQTHRVSVDGIPITVLASDAEPFATFEVDGRAEVVISVDHPISDLRIAPKRHGIVPIIKGGEVRFSIPGPIHLAISIPGLPDLFLWANGPEVRPDATANGVHYFAEGTVTDVGELRLTADETLYLEGGAVVQGVVRATEADGVRIAGPGILDGTSPSLPPQSRRSIVIEGSKKVVIEDIVMIRPTVWMVVLIDCEDSVIRRIKQIGEVSSSDGIDIVGSRRINVEDCFLRNGDDCIVLKSLDLRSQNGVTLDGCKDVEDILITGCAVLSYIGGCALEIGHELRCDHIRRIVFRDCDILAVHRYGAAFGIHNSDHATISDVLYEDIRVEHHYDKLVDLRIVHSRWSRDAKRGQVRNVTFRNIDVFMWIYNAGYSCSLIGGFDAEHTIEGVHFESFRVDGMPILEPDALTLFAKRASDITFSDIGTA